MVMDTFGGTPIDSPEGFGEKGLFVSIYGKENGTPPGESGS
jgi:hypothetical protein